MPTAQVVITGVMTWTESGDGGGRPPDHIWGGGNVPMPNPPIANVPGAPGYTPPGAPVHIWGGGNVPMPSPPIQLPPWLITGGQPPHIWGGGNVPMPSPPIANVPGAPGYTPPGAPVHIWGPPGPWPAPPIAGIPGVPGGPEWNPPTNPPLPPGGAPVPPAAMVPIDGRLVFVPGYGWMFIPDSATPKPDPDRPHIDHTLPGDLPEK